MGARVFSRKYGAMGTEITLSAWTTDEAKAERAFDAGFDEIRRIEILMTDWERPGEPESDVVRINKAAGKEAVRVSAETLEVIEKSLEMSRRSDGAFDITFEAMHGLWKFDEDLEKKLPPAAEIARRRKLIDWRDVVVDPKARTVKLRRPGMRLGLGGIAKGYAVDRCAAVLRGEGLSDFMVQAGGDLFVAGSKGPVNWMVGRARSARRTAGHHRAHADQGPRVLDGGRLRALLRARRQALPPHHRSRDRLSGDRVARGDDLRAHRVPRRRARRRGLHPRARRRDWRWSIRSPTARR